MNSPKRSLNRNQVQSQFDRAASTYDQAASLQREMGSSLLDRMEEFDLPRSVPLIDLGCGTGELLGALAAKGHHNLTGLDLSTKMLEIGKLKSPSATFVQSNLESTPFQDDSFSAVVSNAAIQWCDPDAAAEEIARILSPGGYFFLTTFLSGTLAQWDRAFVSGGYPSRVQPLLAQSNVEEAFISSGLRPLTSKTFRKSQSFDSVNSMFDSIKKIGATNAMDSRQRPMSRAEYTMLLQHFADQLQQHQKLELDFVWLQFVGCKSA